MKRCPSPLGDRRYYPSMAETEPKPDAPVESDDSDLSALTPFMVLALVGLAVVGGAALWAYKNPQDAVVVFGGSGAVILATVLLVRRRRRVEAEKAAARRRQWEMLRSTAMPEASRKREDYEQRRLAQEKLTAAPRGVRGANPAVPPPSRADRPHRPPRADRLPRQMP